MRVKKRIEMDGYEVVERTTKPIGNSAYASVPKSWEGRRVAVILLEPNGEKKSDRMGES